MDMPLAADQRPTILVVDDTPANLTLMSRLLKDRYKVKVAKDGEKALAIASCDGSGLLRGACPRTDLRSDPGARNGDR